ncbi:DUF4412 domain-containing protein [Maribacter sp. Asnod1-A12]|uniref:DUF4412 domain-containing protein n=1 Tax=Maribacter sp. Asnod1-A12 TaxID=3160576 RepID=UPI0038688416
MTYTNQTSSIVFKNHSRATFFLVLLTLLFYTNTKAQNDIYTFDYIYQLEIVNPRGNSTVIDYYLPANGGYFCTKTEGDMITVFDNVSNKMYSYMGRDDKKVLMTMPFSFQGLLKESNDLENPEVHESAGYGRLLGHDCTLFRMTSDNLTSEVWIAEGLIEGSFGENSMTSPMFSYILARSLTLDDDSLKAVYSGLPLRIVTRKKRGRKEKITTMTCTKFERESFQINTSEYERL